MQQLPGACSLAALASPVPVPGPWRRKAADALGLDWGLQEQLAGPLLAIPSWGSEQVREGICKELQDEGERVVCA